MILFETGYTEIFNHTIHYLLKSEHNSDIGDLIEEIAPKYLRREQFDKCVTTFSNLIDWTEDNFYHHLNHLSRILLYQFMNRNGMQSTLYSLRKNKRYQLKLKKIIQKYILDEEKINKNLYHINWYIDHLFIDKHVINILYSNNQKDLRKYLKEYPRISSMYLDIMPLEIQKSFQKDIDLYHTIEELIDFMQKNINYGSLSHLFWHNNLPMLEIEIQEVLICLLDAYFYKVDIDINRETSIGDGKIDFKFYRNQDEKILFELKKANNKNLKFGYEKQVIDYMKACRCEHAYYIILCFNDKDINTVQKFVEKIGLNTYHYNVTIVVFDLRKRNVAILNHNESIFYVQIPHIFDSYFGYISKILTLNTNFEMIDYLEKILDNYKNIDNENIKQDYISKVHEISTFYQKSDFHSINLFDKDKFYIIYEKDSLRRLVLSLLNDIENESGFLMKINEILNLLRTFNNNEYNERISKNEIIEIFKYLKEERPRFYQLIKSKQLRIYLLNETSIEFNSSVIPTLNITGYLMLCSNMINQEKEGYALYVFFFLLGQILNWSIVKAHRTIPDSFLTAMLPYTQNIKKEDPNACTLFADSVAMYLMHNSKYDKWNPFAKIDSVVYQKLQNYFDKLLEEEVSKDDFIFQ